MIARMKTIDIHAHWYPADWLRLFEKDGPRYYNSVAVADADGEIVGLYRKSHIPDGPGYMEKYYFRPGDTGFKVWDTKFGRIGVGICWDQWFPECARAMAYSVDVQSRNF